MCFVAVAMGTLPTLQGPPSAFESAKSSSCAAFSGHRIWVLFLTFPERWITIPLLQLLKAFAFLDIDDHPISAVLG